MRKILILTIVLFFISFPVSAKKNKDLPPGLQKKMQRGGELPPGWKKKLAKGKILDRRVYDQGRIISRPDSHGIITIKIDDRLIKLHKDTRKILEIISH